MITITDKSKCCGCTACASICPVKCISMQSDKEGFQYPVVDGEKCINCGLCNKKCPVLNHTREPDEDTGFYVARAKNSEVVKASTSGGFISPIADYVFDKNGVVCGAVFDEDFKVVHQIFERKDRELAIQKMRGSKYVQSDIGGIFEKVKKCLEENLLVCFVGTPCQIYGLHSYLGGVNYENLITIDLVCHGVPSPKLWKHYINYQQEQYKSKIKNIYFRNKTYGYHSSTMKIEFLNGKTYYGSARVDYMLKSFFSEISSRPSCYQCAFKGISSKSDFTVYDCWRPSQLVEELEDDNRGYSNVITHTKKAAVILTEIGDKYALYRVDRERAVRCVDRIVIHSAIPHRRRDAFYDDIDQTDLDSHIREFIPVTAKDRFMEKIKPFAYRAGVFDLLKNTVKRFHKV